VIEHRVEHHLPYAVCIKDSGVHVSVRLCVCPFVGSSVCFSVTITVIVCLPVCLTLSSQTQSLSQTYRARHRCCCLLVFYVYCMYCG